MYRKHIKALVTGIFIGAAAILLIASATAIWEPPVTYENEYYGLVIVDAGEWGEVLPFTPKAPTPQITTPPPISPTPTINRCPAPIFTWLEVVIDRAPLREIASYNNNGYPIFTIYSLNNVSNRYIAKIGKLLCAWASPIKGDGGNYAFKLISSQIVDGRWLPANQYLYILTKHVASSQEP